MNLTKEQALEIEYFHCGPCSQTIGVRGSVTTRTECWRRNGRTKVWARRPDHWEIPIKHGLRDHARITPANQDQFHTPAECVLASSEKVAEREMARKLPYVGEVIAQVIQGMSRDQRKALSALSPEKKIEIALSPFPEALAVMMIAEQEQKQEASDETKTSIHRL